MRADALTLLALQGLVIEIARATGQPLRGLIKLMAEADGATFQVITKETKEPDDLDDEDDKPTAH